MAAISLRLHGLPDAKLSQRSISWQMCQSALVRHYVGVGVSAQDVDMCIWADSA
jgi:hypothetical protein